MEGLESSGPGSSSRCLHDDADQDEVVWWGHVSGNGDRLSGVRVKLDYRATGERKYNDQWQPFDKDLADDPSGFTDDQGCFNLSKHPRPGYTETRNVVYTAQQFIEHVGFQDFQRDLPNAGAMGQEFEISVKLQPN